MLQFASLEAKVLEEQLTDGPKMIFSKWKKIKSRRYDHLSYHTIIINKLDFYSKVLDKQVFYFCCDDLSASIENRR